MHLSVFTNRSSGSGSPRSAVQTCVAKMRTKDASQCADLITDAAKSEGESPAAFAKECLNTLRADAPKDQRLRGILVAFLKPQDPVSSVLAERATLPEDLSLRSTLNIMPSEVMMDRARDHTSVDSADNPQVRDRSATEPPSFVDRKDYDTTVFKQGQAARVVRHASAHPEEAKALFTKYIMSGDSGPESRIQKLAQEIQHSNWQVSAALEPVLIDVLSEMAGSIGDAVSDTLISGGGFEADFGRVSVENQLSDGAGLAQLSKDFARGVSFHATDGRRLEQLPEDAKVFIVRFANQQSVAAMVDPNGGELSIPERTKSLLAGTGFRLDGWNNETQGVGYLINVDQNNVTISIPATIAIKPVVLLALSPIPICVATLEMTLDMASGAQSVHMSFQPIDQPG